MSNLNLFQPVKINYDIVEEKTEDGYVITKKVLYNKAGEEQVFSTTKTKIEEIDAKIAELTQLKTRLNSLKVVSVKPIEIIKEG